MKVCSFCKDKKPLVEFYADRQRVDGRQAKCKQCSQEYSKRWVEENADRRAAYVVEYNNRPSRKERLREHGRNRQLAKYGLTQDEYRELLAVQSDRCALCHTDEPGHYRNFCIDHDHQTGAIRGLLCNNCNRALGLFGDDLDVVRAAAEYLDSY